MFYDPLMYPASAQAIAEAHMPQNVLNALLYDYADDLKANLRRSAGGKPAGFTEKLSDIAARVFSPKPKNKWRNVPANAAIVTTLPEGFKVGDMDKFPGYVELNRACKEKDIALVCTLGDRRQPSTPIFGGETKYFDWVVYVDTQKPFSASTLPDLLTMPAKTDKKPGAPTL